MVDCHNLGRPHRCRKLAGQPVQGRILGHRKTRRKRSAPCQKAAGIGLPVMRHAAHLGLWVAGRIAHPACRHGNRPRPPDPDHGRRNRQRPGPVPRKPARNPIRLCQTVAGQKGCKGRTAGRNPDVSRRAHLTGGRAVDQPDMPQDRGQRLHRIAAAGVDDDDLGRFALAKKRLDSRQKARLVAKPDHDRRKPRRFLRKPRQPCPLGNRRIRRGVLPPLGIGGGEIGGRAVSLGLNGGDNRAAGQAGCKRGQIGCVPALCNKGRSPQVACV